jgi:hypothetical protein
MEWPRTGPLMEAFSISPISGPHYQLIPETVFRVELIKSIIRISIFGLANGIGMEK